MVQDFGGIRSLVTNLNISLNKEITRISSDMPESSDEMHAIAIIVCACSRKLMKLQKLDRFINYHLLCSSWNYYG